MNHHTHHHHEHHSDTGTTRYTCPMHPEIHQDTPGMCPECGMALVPEKQPKKSEAHDQHAGHSTEAFLHKFWISLTLTIVVVLYSELPEKLFGFVMPGFPGSRYVGFVLGTFVFFHGGMTFLASAWRELRSRMPGMMTLIALAISAAFVFSVAQTLRGQEHTLFWELTTLITIMLLGHWIEMRAVKGAQGALKELSKLLPDTAEVIRNGSPVVVPLDQVRQGDHVFVRPGGRIPTDGKVINGTSEANEALVTGESAPVTKSVGNMVIGGSINGDGALTIEVTNIGDHTFLAGVMRLVKEAQASKSRLQLLSDRVAFYLTIVAVLVGGAAMVTWLAVGAGFETAIERFVAVLVIACPHALGLAIPLVASISTTLAARNGFLVRQRSALEQARNIDVVLFDKTGTLTQGSYSVTQCYPIGVSEQELLQQAASVDAHSEHPVSKAIVSEAQERGIELLSTEKFMRLAGRGVRAELGGHVVSVGGAALLEELGLPIPDQVPRSNATTIYVVRGDTVIGAIGLADEIRSESRQAVTTLQQMGVVVAMITGDSQEVAQSVADRLGITEYFARVLPGDKSAKVRLLQSQGKRVAMVGDGINDAPALTQADLGIAIGAGTNVAIESAGIILVRNDPRDIPSIIRLSRATYRKMIENLIWASGYNILAIPLAAGVLASQGIILQPAVSAILMSFSTVIVAINALFLRKISLSSSN